MSTATSHGPHGREVRREEPQAAFRPPSPPGASSRRLVVVVGLAAALLLCGVAALPFAVVRPRAAAVFVQDRRLELFLVGTAVFVAVVLGLLIGR